MTVYATDTFMSTLDDGHSDGIYSG